MSTSKQLQHKHTVASSSVVPTYPASRPSRSLVSRPTPTSEQVHPVTQAQLEHAARFGHSFARIPLFPPEQKNSTGLPDLLKAGVENLSGLSMDDVKVHYNSSQPASVQALAYTQGTEIHVGPGQEKHLAHEAWHVVQQKQGRVEATMQAEGVMINDDEGLEREASAMGERANQTGTGNMQRKEISDISFLEEEGMHPLEPVQQYRVDVNTPSIMQFVKQTPAYVPGNHATKVTVDLNKGDTIGAGSRPSVDTDGWDALKALGLTQGTDDVHRWVLFHVLNAKSGGSGVEPANLTPTTQRANKSKEWNKFEKQVKAYIDYESPGSAVEKVAFDAEIKYHSGATIYWEEAGGGQKLETKNSDYPKNVDATLELTDKDLFKKQGGSFTYTASLDETDGLIQPQDLLNVPGWQAYTDAKHTSTHAGTET